MNENNSYYTLTEALETVSKAYDDKLSQVTLNCIRPECSKRVAEHFKDNLIDFDAFDDHIHNRPCATFFFKYEEKLTG